MSAHRTLADLYEACANDVNNIPDPGDTGTINVSKNFGMVELSSAAAETRTLADPRAPGVVLTLVMETDGGDITLTASTAYDEAGSTTMTFDNVGEFVTLISVDTGSDTYVWRVLAHDGVAGPSLDMGNLSVAGTLSVTGATTLTGAVGHTALSTFSAGLVSTAETVTPNNDSGAASSITAGVTNVDVAAVTNDANDWIVLPAIASIPVGHTIKIACNAGGAFEMRTVASSNTKINTVDSDGGSAEYLCTDTEVITVTKVSDTDGYVATAQTALGAIATAVVPD